MAISGLARARKTAPGLAVRSSVVWLARCVLILLKGVPVVARWPSHAIEAAAAGEAADSAAEAAALAGVQWITDRSAPRE